MSTHGWFLANMSSGRLDKKVFKDGLDKLQSKLEQRFYTTTLAFAHDFCEIINVGINTDPKPVPKPKFELMESSPTKQNYNDRRERKRLAKRIIKAVQPHLLQALQAEMDIKRRPMADAANELEGMLEASLEMQQSSVIVTQDAGAAESQDVIMVDVSEPAEAAQITVATDAKPAVDGDATGDNSAGSGDDGREADNADEEMQGAEDNMEAKSTGLTAKPVNGILSSSSSVQGQQDADTANTDKPSAGDAVAAPAASKPTDTPPSEAQVSVTGQPSQQAIAPPGPPTPPRSHGSLGFASSAPTDPLTDGGVPWYLQSFDPQGTTVEDDEEPEFEQEMLRQQQPHQEQQQEQEQEEQPKQQWTSGRDAVLRSLSEDLTDMDDEELKGLLHDDGPAATNSDDDAGKEPRKKTATNSRLSVPVVVAGSRSSARLNRAAAAASNGTASPSKTRSPAADKVAGAPATRAAVAAAAMPMVDDKNEKSDDEEDGDANDDDDDDDDAVASVSASASPARPRSRASAAATSSPVKIKTYANRVRKRTRTSTRRR